MAGRWCVEAHRPVAAALIWLLIGCAGQHADLVDVSERSILQSDLSPYLADEVYRVDEGDSLIGIAMSYDLDHEELVRLNNLRPPYQLREGQVLRLRAPYAIQAPDSPGWEPSSLALPQTAAPSGTSAGAVPPASPAAAPARSARGVAVAQPRSTLPAQRSSTASPQWEWPAGGKLGEGFKLSANPHKGIDILGAASDLITAAAAGNVAYAGDALTGYGKMLIIDHGNRYLSAYAHNSEILVARGDSVIAGQPIARMGSTGTSTIHLHFEIRLKGKPQNPLRLLPAR